MCSPGAALAVQGAGVGMSTVGAFFSAKAQQDQLRAQADIAELNAKQAEQNARYATEAGTFQEAQIKAAGGKLKNTQINRMAGNGIDIAGSPSALAVLTGTDVLTEADANRARANAVGAAWGQRIEAGNFERSAVSARATAKGISPIMAGATSLIEGAGKVAGSWYQLNKDGAFTPQAPDPSTGTPRGTIPYTTGTPSSFGKPTSYLDDRQQHDTLLAWGW